MTIEKDKTQQLEKSHEKSTINSCVNIDKDKLLYADFLNGSNQAFEQLVLKFKNSLIYFLQRYVKDIAICEDIAQDVFAWIYVYKEKYNFETGLKTYIFTIARNKAIDFIRKNKRLISMDEIPNNGLAEYAELVENVIKNDNASLVHRAMEKLKPEYQTAITLVDFEELSYFDAAKIMNKSIPQFKILLFRARKSLKNTLVKEGYTHEN